MIKCIASDMDGTLLNSHQDVSEATIEAIKVAQDKGIDFLVVTGRAYNEVRYVLDHAGIKCPAICVNGGEIRDQDGHVQYSVGLDGATSAKVQAVFDEVNMYFELYTRGGTYTNDLEKGKQVIVDIIHTANPSQKREDIQQGVEERSKQRLIHVVQDYDPIFSAEDCHVYKFLAFSMNEELLLQVSERLKKIAGIEVTSSGRNNLEIMHHAATKGAALKRYTEEKGIALADTMALGDNYNDISMLEMVGHSVAMGNAEEEVKQAARYVTAINNDDGVAKAIMKAINEENISVQ